MQKRLALFILPVLLIASAQMVAAQDHAQNRPLGRPVAIDKLPTGSLYVLDAKGAVHAVDFIGGKPVVTGSFQFPKAWTAADLASAQLNGQNVLFVAANLGMTGEISLYTVTGILKSSWSLPNGVSSVAYDPANSILYATSGHTPEIYRIDVGMGGAPQPIVRTPGSQRLGPIVFDARHNALLVEDLVLGAIYSVDLAQRKAVFFCGGVRSASALKFSADGSLLYVSDDVTRDVVTFSMAQPKAAPRVFAKLPDFRSPSGLAWVGDQLAVSDDEAHRLFIFSKGGSLEDALPALH
jgi:sugar lactone lactonase YvrE